MLFLPTLLLPTLLLLPLSHPHPDSNDDHLPLCVPTAPNWQGCCLAGSGITSCSSLIPDTTTNTLTPVSNYPSLTHFTYATGTGSGIKVETDENTPNVVLFMQNIAVPPKWAIVQGNIFREDRSFGEHGHSFTLVFDGYLAAWDRNGSFSLPGVPPNLRFDKVTQLIYYSGIDFAFAPGACQPVQLADSKPTCFTICVESFLSNLAKVAVFQSQEKNLVYYNVLKVGDTITKNIYVDCGAVSIWLTMFVNPSDNRNMVVMNTPTYKQISWNL